MNGIRIALILAVLIFAGYVSNELGITQDVITLLSTEQNPLDEPGGTGFWDAVKSILAPLVWVFNSLAAFFQVMTFNADVPIMVSAVLLAGVSFFMFYTVVRLIRGGG